MEHNFLVKGDLKVCSLFFSYLETRLYKHAAFCKSNKFKLCLFRQIPSAMEHVLNFLCLSVYPNVCLHRTAKEPVKDFHESDVIHCSSYSVKKNKIILSMHQIKKVAYCNKEYILCHYFCTKAFLKVNEIYVSNNYD